MNPLSIRLSYATILVSILAGISVTILGVIQPKVFNKFPGIEHQFLRDIASLKDKQGQLRIQLKNISEKVDAIINSDEDWKPELQMSALRLDLKNLGSRINEFDKAIMDNPTKAMSLPLLRKDLSNLESDYSNMSAEYAKQIDCIYDQNKWFLGLMCTMAIGLNRSCS